MIVFIYISVFNSTLVISYLIYASFCEFRYQQRFAAKWNSRVIDAAAGSGSGQRRSFFSFWPKNWWVVVITFFGSFHQRTGGLVSLSRCFGTSEPRTGGLGVIISFLWYLWTKNWYVAVIISFLWYFEQRTCMLRSLSRFFGTYEQRTCMLRSLFRFFGTSSIWRCEIIERHSPCGSPPPQLWTVDGVLWEY